VSCGIAGGQAKGQAVRLDYEFLKKVGGRRAAASQPAPLRGLSMPWAGYVDFAAPTGAPAHLGGKIAALIGLQIHQAATNPTLKQGAAPGIVTAWQLSQRRSAYGSNRFFLCHLTRPLSAGLCRLNGYPQPPRCKLLFCTHWGIPTYTASTARLCAVLRAASAHISGTEKASGGATAAT